MDFLLGLCFGFVLGAIVGWNSYGSVEISICKQDLPRSQQCILVAVPEVANDMPNMQER